MKNILKYSKEIIIGILIVSLLTIVIFWRSSISNVNQIVDPFKDAKELLEKKLKESKEEINLILLERKLLLKSKEKSDKELKKLVKDVMESDKQVSDLKTEIFNLNSILKQQLQDEENFDPKSLSDFIDDKLIESGN